MDDVAVIGDGVAGLVAIRALQQSGRVPVLIAPEHNRRESHGETLGPSAGTELDALGWADLLDDRRSAIPVEGRFSVWGSDSLTRHDARSDMGWHVDRVRLEAVMRARVETDSYQPVAGIVRSVERDGDGWSIGIGGKQRFRARFIVDASGRAGVVARRFSERRRLDRLVAAYASIAVPDAELHAASLVDAATNGWWYTSVLPDMRLLIAFFTDADLVSRGVRHDAEVWSSLVRAAPDATSARLESLGVLPEGPADGIADAATLLLEEVSGERWIAVGDAAAAFDPLASHGLAVALWSGRRAAMAVDAQLNGDPAPLDAYRSSVQDGVNQFLSGFRFYYGAERRFAGQPFWQRRHDLLDSDRLNRE